jgi:hypothetical protein
MMGKYHLIQYFPTPKMHGVKGFNEVIETVTWGLQQLGYGVTFGINQFDPSATNILFGPHLLSMEFARALPKNTIIYNLEQALHVPAPNLPPTLRYCIEQFQLWEYSEANMPTWEAVRGARVKFVPIGYSPTLSRIRSADRRDIDVLIYGQSAEKRLIAFHTLAQAALCVVFACGVYGSDRDQLIARSKIVLNVSLYDERRIFEVVRVSYLFANRKAVVAVLDPNTYIEPEIAAAVKCTTLAQLAGDCERILASEAERTRLETCGFETIRKRDIRGILRSALG